MAISNLNIVKSWINHLQQDDVMAAIVGQDKAILHKLEHCYITDDQIYFLTESPLLGEAGMDFSVQLELSAFKKMTTIGMPAEDEEFIKKYAAFLQYQGRFYLECDTHSGDSGKVAFFVDTYQQSCLELAKYFEQEKYFYTEKQKDMLLKILVELPNDLLLSYIGIMSSREDRSIRLGVSTREPAHGSLKEQLEWISKLGYCSEASIIAKDLEGIAELQGFDIFVTIDIMTDGTLGDILGCELKPLADSIEVQRKMLESVQFNTLLQRFDKLKLMDKRIWYAGYGIFYATLPQDGHKQEGLYSMLSHFKLRWKNGRHLPAKIYFCCYRG